MATLQFAPRALDDIERSAEFLRVQSPRQAAETAGLVVEALGGLKRHPLLGRPVEEGLREILISRGRSGCIALYRYQPAKDTVLVLRVRHPREGGF